MAFWNKEKPKAEMPPEPVKEEPVPVPETPPAEVIPVPEKPAPKPEQKPAPEKKVKSAPNRKRPYDVHVWFDEAEERKLERRLEQTGLSKGVFLRKAALDAPILVDTSRQTILAELKKITSELKQIHAELGRIGGMLKMIIKPNEAQRTLNPEEFEKLIQTNHFLVKNQKQVAKVMEAVNGYFKAQQL